MQGSEYFYSKGIKISAQSLYQHITSDIYVCFISRRRKRRRRRRKKRKRRRRRRRRSED